MLYYDDEDGDEGSSPDSVGFVEEDHPLQLHGNRELAAQAVKLLQVPSRTDNASFTTSTTDMDVPIYVRRPSGNLGNKVRRYLYYELMCTIFHFWFVNCIFIIICIMFYNNIKFLSID